MRKEHVRKAAGLLLALLAVAALAGGCGNSSGTDAAATTTTTTTTTPTTTIPTTTTTGAATTFDPTPATSGLDDAGGNACYLFFKFVDDADTLTDDEIHGRVKDIWDGTTFASGAQDSSNDVIRMAARAMLVDEVNGDWTAFGQHSVRLGNTCKRMAP